MDPAITPKQTLFLWRLLMDADGQFLNQMKPELTATERNQLLAAGLIEIEKRKATAKSRASNFALLTEKGWSWAEQNLDAKLPTQGTAALTVLGKLLAKLKQQINRGELSLVALLAPQPAEPAAPVAPERPHDLKSRLVEACRTLTGDGVYGVRIRLADLRTQLADVPRLELDQVLQDLEQSEAAALMPLDDPREIGPADEAAALPNSSGASRHLLYLAPPHKSLA